MRSSIPSIRQTCIQHIYMKFCMVTLLTLLLLSGSALASPVISRSQVTLSAGMTKRLKIKNAAGQSVTWRSSRPSIASVSSKGLVTAKKGGKATIKATVGDITLSCRFTIRSLTFKNLPSSLAAGESVTLNLKKKNITRSVKWKSSDPSVATVDANGQITAYKAGSVTITAKAHSCKAKCQITVTGDKWDQLLAQYRFDPTVHELLFVQYTGGSDADVLYYSKENSSWRLVFSDDGDVGRLGIGKAREGDARTPSGTYTLTSAFGIKNNPGSLMPYVKVNPYLYWCGDEYYYNQLIDIREHPHNCQGEHLINYDYAYDYGMFLDFNPDNIYLDGSAIFLHCKDFSGYTGGCIGVDYERMIQIIQTAHPGTKICIYEK